QRAVDAIAHDLRRAAARERDDRRTRCERLDADDPEVILGWKDETTGRGHELALGRVVDTAGERDVVRRDLLQRVALAPLSHDDQAAPRVRERAHGDLR